jgi:hypothetical protein
VFTVTITDEIFRRYFTESFEILFFAALRHL